MAGKWVVWPLAFLWSLRFFIYPVSYAFYMEDMLRQHKSEKWHPQHCATIYILYITNAI
jgi:hypothetical protein